MALMRVPAFSVNVLILMLLMYIMGGDAAGEIYKWIDRDGQAHFTDDYALIPPEYRHRVQARPSSPPSEPLPAPPLSGTSKQGKASKSPPPRLPSTGGLAKVVAVLDGDTIIISGGEKVRYAGLNTPESHHPDKLPEYCGQEALEANRRLVAGKTVRLEFDERRRDKYGRLLAYVYVDGLSVNAELIRQGHAQVSTFKDNQRYHQEFTRLQQSAIAARRGLWGGCVDSRVPQAKPHVEPKRR
jgi:endonuclease YncB( thermonuclease family)